MKGPIISKRNKSICINNSDYLIELESQWSRQLVEPSPPMWIRFIELRNLHLRWLAIYSVAINSGNRNQPRSCNSQSQLSPCIAYPPLTASQWSSSLVTLPISRKSSENVWIAGKEREKRREKERAREREGEKSWVSLQKMETSSDVLLPLVEGWSLVLSWFTHI